MRVKKVKYVVGKDKKVRRCSFWTWLFGRGKTYRVDKTKRVM